MFKSVNISIHGYLNPYYKSGSNPYIGHLITDRPDPDPQHWKYLYCWYGMSIKGINKYKAKKFLYLFLNANEGKKHPDPDTPENKGSGTLA